MATNTVAFSTRAAQVEAAMKNQFPSTVKGIPINGQMQTLTDGEQVLQDYVDADAAVQTAKTAYKAAIAARRSKLAAAKIVYAGVIAFAKALFAGDTAVLAAFGVEEKPRTKPSSSAIAIGVAKRQAALAKKEATKSTPATERVVVYGADGQPIGAPTAAVPTAPAATGK